MVIENKILITGLFILAFGQVYGQCSSIQVAINYIESSLKADLFYTGEFSKEEIREPIIWYMDEKIPFDTNIFGDVENNAEAKVKCKKIINPKQDVSINEANFLLFASNLYENRLLIKLLNNRDANFNLQGGKTKYEKWSRMNGGMTYMFTFNKSGCLLQVQKKYEFND